jgi:hypothetical protein
MELAATGTDKCPHARLDGRRRLALRNIHRLVPVIKIFLIQAKLFVLSKCEIAVATVFL